MRIVSFNVNSLRARLHQLQTLINSLSPDIIGLQETKVSDEEFPVDALKEMGYQAVFHGQKSHYGVALLSRQTSLNPVCGFSHDDEESQRRFVSAQFTLADGRVLTVMNGYFPQGENRDHPTKFPNKQAFYAHLYELLAGNYDPDQPLVLMGDMNIAPSDLDIGIGEPNAKRWLREGKCCFLPEERQWLGRLMDWGMIDTYRNAHPHVNDRFSWFDYRSRGFEAEPKRGLRIDLILSSRGLDRVTAAGIDYEVRSMDKPSDHCPIWADFGVELAAT
jgi:exodeoxyribonuclease III